MIASKNNLQWMVITHANTLLYLWRHTHHPVVFSLMMHNFGIKYTGDHNTRHLLDALKQHYTIMEDLTCSSYCGITLKWDYVNGTVDYSMHGYIENAVHCFQHLHPEKPQHAPHQWSQSPYGSKA
jgi:hypothetical protein